MGKKRGSPAIDVDEVLALIAEGGESTALSRGQAATVLAARTMKQGADVKKARNRCGMQLDNAVRRGQLTVDAQGRFCAGKVFYWAIKPKNRHIGTPGYPEASFEDLPRTLEVVFVQASSGQPPRKPGRFTL